MAKSSSGKSRFWRWMLVSALALAVLFVSVLLIIPRLLPWDKIKQQAEEKISALVHHDVSVGEIGFNLFRGITLRDIRVANAPGFSETPLLTDESASLQYRLLPLIFGQVMIKAVVLEKPQLLIECAADGTFNFSDMLPQSQAEPEDTSEKRKKRPTVLPLELLVSEFAVNQAALVYRDLGSQQEYRVEGLNVRVSNLTLAGVTPVTVEVGADVKALGQTYPVSLEAKWRFNYAQALFHLDRVVAALPGVKLEAAGKVEQMLTEPALLISGKADVDFGMVWKKLLPPDVRKKMPADFKISGTALATFNARGPAKKPDQLQVDIEDTVELSLGVLGLEIPLAVSGTLELREARAQLAQTATLPGVKAQARATLADLFGERRVSASVDGEVDLAEAMKNLIPPGILKKIPGLASGGSLTFQTAAKGLATQPDRLALSGHVAADAVSLSYQERELLQGLSMQLDFQSDQIKVKQLKTDLAGHPLTASFQASGFDLRRPESLKPDNLKANIKWSLKSKLLDLDALLALVPKKDEKGEKGKKAAAQPLATVSDLPEPDARSFIPYGLVMTGEAALGGIKFGKVTLGRLDFSLQQKKRILTTTSKLRGYQGKLSNTTRLDFTQRLLAYRVGTEVKGVDLEPLLNDVVDTFVAAKLKKPELIAELKDKFVGKLTGTMNLSGRGMRTAQAMPNLTGKGQYVLKAGRLRKFAFQDQLAGWFGSDKLRQDIPFDHTELEFTLGKERVNVKKFVMESGVRGESGDIRITAKGQMTFKADFKNFKLRPRLNPRAAQTLSPQFRAYSEVLKDDRGWVTLPVVMNGPMKKPDVKPDWNWIKNQFGAYAKKKTQTAAKKAEKKAKAFVDKQKGKTTDEIQKNASEELEKAKEKLKNLNLRNLFK